MTIQEVLNWSDKHQQLKGEGVRVVHVRHLLEAFVKEFVDSLPRKFWEDEDHAVGGYISKKDLKEYLNQNLGEVISTPPTTDRI